jgi:hypothetical protein
LEKSKSNIIHYPRYNFCAAAYVYFLQSQKEFEDYFTNTNSCHSPLASLCTSYNNWHFITVKTKTNFEPLILKPNLLITIRNAVLEINKDDTPKIHNVLSLQRQEWYDLARTTNSLPPFNFSQYRSCLLKQRNNYNGEPIQIYSFMPIRPRFPEKYRRSLMRNEEVTYPGLILAHYVLKKANASIPPYKLGKETVLSWISVPQVFNDRLRNQRQISRIVGLNYVTFIAGEAKPLGQSFRFLVQPFQISVWLYILLTLVVLISVSLVLSRVDHKKESNSKWQIAGMALPLLLDQSISSLETLTQGRNHFKIVMGTWLLCVIVIVNAYKSNIAAFLIQPVYTSPPRTFKQLISERFQLFTLVRAFNAVQLGEILSQHLNESSNLNLTMNLIVETDTSRKVRNLLFLSAKR